MQKMTLDLERIEVVTFEIEAPEGADHVAAISGTACVSRPTIYGTCCTP